MAEKISWPSHVIERGSSWFMVVWEMVGVLPQPGVVST